MKVELKKLLNDSVENMGSGIHSVVKESALEMIKRAYEENIYVKITSGYRSFAEQAKLYGQGRNNYIYEGKQYANPNENVVTHAEPGESNHNFGLAIDFVLLSEDGKKALWEVDNYWKHVAAIGKQLGFQWGGDWNSFKDYPHLEMIGGLTLSQLRAGKQPKLVSNIANIETVSVKKENAAIIKEAVVPYPNKLFKVTSPLISGKDIERIQRAIGVPEKDIDGKYGKDTEKLVKAYQKKKGLVSDGIVGKDTWNVMF